MVKRPRQRGFTLVEMLVVIAIIVVLMAILFPVFSRVRARARETRCINNLAQLSTALKQYRDTYGRFPPPPVFVNGRYYGGFSALYPDYVDSTEVLICPDDADVKGLAAQTSQNVYSSYNGRANNPHGGDWTFKIDAATGLPEIYYNYNGYTFSGSAGGPITSNGIDNGGAVDAAYFAVLDLEYRPKGLRHRDAPRLCNRSAPGNTMITHCVHHEDSGSAANQTEFVGRLEPDTNPKYKRGALEQDPDGNGPKIAPYISQLK